MDSLETIPGDKVTMHTSRSQLEKASVSRPKIRFWTRQREKQVIFAIYTQHSKEQ